MVYMPVVIPALTKLGLMEAVSNTAFLNHEGVAWRNLDGELLARLPLSSSDPNEFGGVLLLGQYRFAMLLLEELKKYPSVEVHFGWRYGGIEQSEETDHANVLMYSRKHNQTDAIIRTRYVVGADGANSTVRRSMAITFDGFSYPDWLMIGTDVVYDFIKEEGMSPLNFVVHPEHW